MPELSVVVLAWNEEGTIGRCLQSLARQTTRSFEVIVLDAHSEDGTVGVARDVARHLPVPARVVEHDHRIPIGVARNRGAELARAPHVAYVSADAELHERWIEEALATLRSAAIVYGFQVHAPDRWTVGAAVRGLRYHFPREVPPDAARYASNVAAAYRRELLLAQPFHPTTPLDDMLAARRARAAGHRIAYNPRMIAYHHDVVSSRDEWRKNLIEGRGWGIHRPEIGLHRLALAWAGLLVAALLLVAAVPAPVTGLTALLIVWLPTLRRATQRGRTLPLRALTKGFVVSPLFDLAFLVSYLRGLASPEAAPRTPPRNLETQA